MFHLAVLCTTALCFVGFANSEQPHQSEANVSQNRVFLGKRVKVLNASSRSDPLLSSVVSGLSINSSGRIENSTATTQVDAMFEAASDDMCTDTPNWNNGYSRCGDESLGYWPYCEVGKGWTCAGYAAKGWCRSDRCLSPGETGGVYACGDKLKSPEDNCCACGGGSKQPSCASEGQSCGWNNAQTQSCCDGMQCKPFVGGSNMQCVRAPPSCAREGQSCGWNNAQTQSCCDDMECTPFLGGSDMQCVKKQSTCVAQGDYCGGPGQRTLECCSGDCQYPPNSNTMVCRDA